MSIPKKNIEGTILRIQRMSTEDGPGIRSTVFFKGCPLSCVWCHNPESISPQRQVHWEKARCIGCRSCIESCVRGAITAAKSGIVIERSLCDSCGACARVCPSAAMDIYGEVSTPPDLARQVLKDKAYFQKTGGVTLSGGEPTMQPLFVKELLSIFRKEGIHTALDTCGQCTWETLEELLPYTDVVLYDLKEINPDKHKEFTGVSNARILENLALLGRFIKEQRKPRELWIRTPLIPGYTATRENLRGIGAFIGEYLGQSVNRWELCTFNNLCIHKYESLGINWRFSKSPLLSRDDAQRLALQARNYGLPPEIVHLSGPTQENNPEKLPEDLPDNNIAQRTGC